MAYAPLFTQAQLEIALGGADRLRQLAKASGPNDPVLTTFVVEVQAAASGNVYAILQVAFNPGDAAFPAAAYVQERAVSIGVYWAWHKGTGGVGVPDEVKTAKAEAEADLDKSREGLRSLGADITPGAQLATGQVDPDPNGVRVTRDSMKAFS